MVRALTREALDLGRSQFDRPLAARVTKVSGGLFVALESVPELEIGPCAWQRPLAAHTHTITGGSTGSYTAGDPPLRTRCLVQFAGDGVTDPWVVAFDAWPA